MTGARAPDAFVDRVNRRFFYGWVLVAAAVLILFASGPGQSHTFGVFLTYVADDLGLSHTEISFAYGVATLAAAFGLPYAGRHVDRRGRAGCSRWCRSSSARPRSHSGS